MKILNVAIIGFGLSGRYLQAPFFEAHPNFNLKMIVTNNKNPTDSTSQHIDPLCVIIYIVLKYSKRTNNFR